MRIQIELEVRPLVTSSEGTKDPIFCLKLPLKSLRIFILAWWKERESQFRNDQISSNIRHPKMYDKCPWLNIIEYLRINA